MGKERVVLVLLFILIFFNLANIILNLSTEKAAFTGKGITTGTISLIVEGESKTITIHSPENTTYNFNTTQSKIIDLNVSADFSASNWEYTLIDLRHNTTVYQDVPFNPNSTIIAVRWSNNLKVAALDENGLPVSANVTFFVLVPNSAPYIESLNENIYVCENEYLSAYFNATDYDEDMLTSDISPKNPFYVFPISALAVNKTRFEIISGILRKNKVGIYNETVYISDGEYSDSKNTTITVIGINNAPSVENIGVRTIYSRGENSSFIEQVIANDTEDGNYDSGNLTFVMNVTGDLFNISSIGLINFTANSSQVGIYNISLCVSDLGINDISPNISLCNNTGLSASTCQNFSLTVTNANRPPVIIDYSPSGEINKSGLEDINLNITTYDPDWTIADVYWYVDGVFKEYDSGSNESNFNYAFPCAISGRHNITVYATDGLANDSLEWRVNLKETSCPVAGSAGGGGASSLVCMEKWGCSDFGYCQSAQESLNQGILSGAEFRDIDKVCKDYLWGNEACGFQTRICQDFKFCNTTLGKPLTIIACQYTQNPNCFDNIKNCHDNECEILTDCGGPCKACPTCSDRIQNQGEKGIDCEGPCPVSCEEKPKTQKTYYLITLVVFLILTIVIIKKIINILRIKRGKR